MPQSNFLQNPYYWSHSPALHLLRGGHSTFPGVQTGELGIKKASLSLTQVIKHGFCFPLSLHPICSLWVHWRQVFSIVLDSAICSIPWLCVPTSRLSRHQAPFRPLWQSQAYTQNGAHLSLLLRTWQSLYCIQVKAKPSPWGAEPFFISTLTLSALTFLHALLTL